MDTRGKGAALKGGFPTVAGTWYTPSHHLKFPLPLTGHVHKYICTYVVQGKSKSMPFLEIPCLWEWETCTRRTEVVFSALSLRAQQHSDGYEVDLCRGSLRCRFFFFPCSDQSPSLCPSGLSMKHHHAYTGFWLLRHPSLDCRRQPLRSAVPAA